jgi:pimeloyl-ACP methyl ester carboxylesterase
LTAHGKQYFSWSIYMLKQIVSGVLSVGYLEYGTPKGNCVVLLHGFPYDVNAYLEVAPILAAANHRVIVPYLRGYGPTRFLSSDTPRSGQQAALGYDLKSLLDALQIETAILAGYDWGGTAACVLAALYPKRVNGLVITGGYKIQQIEGALKPEQPEDELRYWYQYYFHGERGRAGLAKHRREFCRLLWKQWSPNWQFDEATYTKTAESFENNDFVDVVIHSYRHRFGLVVGDPTYEEIERRLAVSPVIAVPSIVLEGAGDGVTPVGIYSHLDHLFVNGLTKQLISQVGHNLPQEAPQAFAAAVLDLSRQSQRKAPNRPNSQNISDIKKITSW